MMSPKRFFFVLNGAILVLVIAIIGGVIYGNGLIKAKSDKLIEARTSNKITEEQQNLLAQAKIDIKKYEELNKIATTIVPQDKDQAKTIREINAIANESGIALRNFTFQSSSLGQAAAPAAKPTDDASKTTAPVTKLPDITQIKPVDGIAGLYYLEITIASVDTQPIPYPDFIKFLERLENNRRTAHVDKLAIKPTPDGSALSFSLNVRAYVKP